MAKKKPAPKKKPAAKPKPKPKAKPAPEPVPVPDASARSPDSGSSAVSTTGRPTARFPAWASRVRVLVDHTGGVVAPVQVRALELLLETDTPLRPLALRGAYEAMLGWVETFRKRHPDFRGKPIGERAFNRGCELGTVFFPSPKPSEEKPAPVVLVNVNWSEDGGHPYEVIFEWQRARLGRRRQSADLSSAKRGRLDGISSRRVHLPQSTGSARRVTRRRAHPGLGPVSASAVWIRVLRPRIHPGGEFGRSDSPRCPENRRSRSGNRRPLYPHRRSDGDSVCHSPPTLPPR